MKLTRLQEELKPWTSHNFGDVPSWQPLLGIVEELGEFLSSKDDEDSLADMTIYLADFANKEGIILSGGVDMDLELEECIAKLCHHYLKRTQGIRLNENHSDEINKLCQQLVYIINTLCGGILDKSIEDVVYPVWDKVNQRNWKKDPIKGGV